MSKSCPRHGGHQRGPARCPDGRPPHPRMRTARHSVGTVTRMCRLQHKHLCTQGAIECAPHRGVLLSGLMVDGCGVGWRCTLGANYPQSWALCYVSSAAGLWSTRTCMHLCSRTQDSQLHGYPSSACAIPSAIPSPVGPSTFLPNSSPLMPLSRSTTFWYSMPSSSLSASLNTAALARSSSYLCQGVRTATE